MQKISKILLIIILGPIGVAMVLFITIAMLPVIIVMVLWGIYLKIFERLRNDPKVKFKRLVQKDSIENTQTLENAIAYFEILTSTIAHESGATIGTLEESVAKSDDDYDQHYNRRLLTYKKTCFSDYAQIIFEMKILEQIDDHGQTIYYSFDDDEDSELAGSINARITLKDTSNQILYTQIQFDELAAHFCIAILHGDGRYNQTTGQIWAYLAAQKVWMVQYSQEKNNFGFRKSKEVGRARQAWFD